jgi:hypothetical protein
LGPPQLGFHDLGGAVGAAELLDINLTRTRQAPIVLIVVLGVMSVGVLAYLSTNGVRARSTEIAVTRALGFDRRQVRRAAAWRSPSSAASRWRSD